jgi:predicted NBD/HSP70 family sugar kinase
MATRRAGQGASSAQIRHYNQRLILQRLRRFGEASRADLARAAALTNTAIGDIVKQLEAAGLVRTVGKKHEGQRGQPATLLSLDPNGAFAIGVRVDRARIETVLTDLGGNVLAHYTHDGMLPPPAATLDLVRRDIRACVAQLPPVRRARITGIGVARPYRLGSWLTELDLPREAFAAWDGVDFAAQVARACGFPAFEENDGTAAAIAELFHGHGRARDDFLYLFIGPAIGGGIVLGGNYLRGTGQNAADVGVIPVAPSRLASSPRRARHEILLGRASLNALIRHLRYRGVAVTGLDGLHAAAAQGSAAMEEWQTDCVDALIDPLLAARALLDVPVVVIDSDLDPAWTDVLITRIQPALTAAAAAAEGRSAPQLVRGSFGAMAGALGAATLPLFIHFGPGAGTIERPAGDTSRTGGRYALVA